MKFDNIKDIKPWWSHEVMDFVDDFLTKDMTVFEWGSGGSTIWLAKRAKEIYTVEHDESWADWVVKTSDALDEVSGSIHVLVLDEKSNEYVEVIQEVSKDTKFDLIIIDGRNRVGCFNQVMRLKQETPCWLLVDDIQRPRYHEICDVLDEQYLVAKFVEKSKKKKPPKKIRNTKIYRLWERGAKNA